MILATLAMIHHREQTRRETNQIFAVIQASSNVILSQSSSNENNDGLLSRVCTALAERLSLGPGTHIRWLATNCNSALGMSLFSKDTPDA